MPSGLPAVLLLAEKAFVIFIPSWGECGRFPGTGRVGSCMKIFPSDAREDEARVTEIYDALLREGHDPWMDLGNLAAGENWCAGSSPPADRADGET
jgi:hypothetical protein